MRLDEKPIFRRVIAPWYDSETVCFLLIAFMLLVFLFGLVGLSVASETAQYDDDVWVPILLIALSGTVIVSVTIRLITRFTA